MYSILRGKILTGLTVAKSSVLSIYIVVLEIGLIPNHDETVKEFEKTKRLLNLHIKLELGLETIYQISGQLILLGLAFTEVGFFYKNMCPILIAESGQGLLYPI